MNDLCMVPLPMMWHGSVSGVVTPSDGRGELAGGYCLKRPTDVNILSL